jgi:hypothetical protein
MPDSHDPSLAPPSPPANAGEESARPSSADGQDESHHQFPWLIFLVALVAATAGHWLALDLYHAAAVRFGGWLVPVSFLGTSLFALWLRHAHHLHPHPRRKRDAALQFLLVWCVFGSGIWFASSLERWLLDGPLQLHARHGVFLVLSAGIVIGFSYWQSRLAPGFTRPRSLRPVLAKVLSPEHQFEALVLCVSTPNQRQLVTPSSGLPVNVHAQVFFGDGDGVAVLRGQSVQDDIKEITRAAEAAYEDASRKAREAGKQPPAFKPYWNWQQLLRAIEYHPALKEIWLVGSPGERGSFSRLEECQRFLAPYGRGIVRCLPRSVEFEDFDGLVSAIRGLLAKELRGRQPARIGVDITGGQKVASIAGAALTMNRELRIQYVQTNDPFEAVTYQLFFDNPPSPHGH